MRASSSHQKRQAVINIPKSQARTDTVCPRKGRCQPPCGTGGAELGSEGEKQDSEPGPGQLCLWVPQSDEPVGLPPARQQSPVRGGVKRAMCGFPCKQYLELQREAGVSRASGRSLTPLTVAAELMASVWLYPLSSEPVRKREQEHRQQPRPRSRENAKWKPSRRFGMRC